MRLWLSMVFMFLSLTSFAEQLNFGVEKLNYLPYYQHTNGNYEGFARELFDAFGQQNQYSMDYKILPTARLLSELLNHHIDFKFPDNPNWQKERKQDHSILYSTSIVESTDGIIVLADNLSKNIEQFKKIAIVRGFTPWAIMDKVNDKAIEIIEVNSIDTLLKQVIHRRVDGAYVNVKVVQYYWQQKFKKNPHLVFNTKLPFDKSQYYLSTIHHKKILKQFNQWISTHTALVNKLKLKWDL